MIRLFQKYQSRFLRGVNMQDILALYRYIKNKYDNYQMIHLTDIEIKIDFHDDFEMRIRLQGFYGIYFNNIFYYNVDWQDIQDTVDDFLTNQYAFCVRNKKLEILKLCDFYDDTKYDHVWTIEKTLK